MPFLEQELTPVSSVKDLGIALDSHLNFNDHVNTLTLSLLSMLCKINRVRRLFTKSFLSIILNSLIFSTLFTVPLSGHAPLRKIYRSYS